MFEQESITGAAVGTPDAKGKMISKRLTQPCRLALWVTSITARFGLRGPHIELPCVIDNRTIETGNRSVSS